VDDKFSKPTSVREIGRMVMALLGRPDLAGLFHLTHVGEPESRWSIATKVVRLGHEAGLLESCPEVQPEAMERAKRMRVVRPVHTAMDPARLRTDLHWRGVSWEEEARISLESLSG
ncbi:MAG: sugar nucleotide-binding protein, partial [Roseibacillus sp.]|nr:sugar nucleotide-binding protein [Roseibacillus sp.]